MIIAPEGEEGACNFRKWLDELDTQIKRDLRGNSYKSCRASKEHGRIGRSDTISCDICGHLG
jgi:hypothetical protein